MSQKITLPFEFMDDYSKETTIHGVKYFSERERHWSEKLFWLAIFVVSIVCCVKNVMQIYEKRQTRPVMISFAKSLSPTFEIPFPAVTICPETKAMVEKFNFTDVLNPNSENSPEDEENLKALFQVCDFGDHSNLSKFFSLADSRDIVTNLEDISIPMDEIFESCRYGSRKTFDCKNEFHKVINDEGLCYTFNMLDESEMYRKGMLDKKLRYPKNGMNSDWFLEKEYESINLKVYPHRVIGSGVPAGLSVELKMRKSSLNPGCKRGIQGFRLALHSPVEVSQVSKEFYSVPLQKETTIAVKPNMIYSSKDVKGYDPVARQCFFNKEKKLKFFKTYTKSSCELECLTAFTFSLCGCVKFSMPRENSTTVCDHSKLECAYEAERNFTTRELERKLLEKQLKRDLKHGNISKNDDRFKKLKDMELCDCLPSCTSLRYEAEISQTDFFIDDEEFLNARVNIYFKSSHFTRLKRYEIYGFSDFLSSTGGIFGLFLGCSVLSFIEIVYHLIAYCVRKFKQRSSEISITPSRNVIE